MPGAEYVPQPGVKAAAAGGAQIQVDASGETATAAAAAAEEGDAASEHRVKRFTPFSVGPRDCIGQNLAKINYQTTVPMLLANFSFKLSEEVTPVCTVQISLLGPNHSLTCALSTSGDPT